MHIYPNVAHTQSIFGQYALPIPYWLEKGAVLFTKVVRFLNEYALNCLLNVLSR